MNPTEAPVEWRRFFDAHALRYEENPFTRHTQEEIDFFLSLFPIARGARILDVGCGTGRHSIELARRGYAVTGVDLSEGMLAVARRNAEAAGVEVGWAQGDASEALPEGPFDAAICLCEGAFGLIGAADDPEEHDRRILANVAASLRPAAPFLLTALNGYSAIRRFTDAHVQSGAFNPATMVAEYEDDWDLPEGRRTVVVRERLFIPPEVVRMLKESGFRVDAVHGGTAGSWGRRPISLDEVEAMYVCRRA